MQQMRISVHEAKNFTVGMYVTVAKQTFIVCYVGRNYLVIAKPTKYRLFILWLKKQWNKVF